MSGHDVPQVITQAQAQQVPHRRTSSGVGRPTSRPSSRAGSRENSPHTHAPRPRRQNSTDSATERARSPLPLTRTYSNPNTNSPRNTATSPRNAVSPRSRNSPRGPSRFTFPTPVKSIGPPEDEHSELARQWRAYVKKHNGAMRYNHLSEQCDAFSLWRRPVCCAHAESKDKDAPLFVLSCDGGGVRGAATAAAMQAIEEEFGIKFAHWDIFCGNSTGAFIAGMLGCCEASAAEILCLYQTQASVMMPQKCWLDERTYELTSLLTNSTHFTNEGKELVLRLALRKSEDGTQKTMKYVKDKGKQLLVPAYRIGTHPGLRVFDSDKDMNEEVWQVCHASSAAPIYFPATQVGNEKYIDGGVVLNNPVFAAITAAERKAHGRKVHVLSLGSGAPRPTLKEKVSTLSALGDGILDFMTDCTSQAYMAEEYCRARGWKYLRIDGPLGLASTKVEDIRSDNIKKLVQAGRGWAQARAADIKEFLAP